VAGSTLGSRPGRVFVSGAAHTVAADSTIRLPRSRSSGSSGFSRDSWRRSDTRHARAPDPCPEIVGRALLPTWAEVRDMTIDILARTTFAELAERAVERKETPVRH
jgi:hypothetical protein